MSDTPTFASKGWYRVRDRGWAAIVYCDRERDRDEPGLPGTLVSIDGELFKCIGVERQPKGGTIRAGEEIGLLVRNCK